MTREEEFYAAILAAINGDDHTCPTPVWRIEEFLKAIHDAIANGGGGGSSGGGVLMVRITNPSSDVYVADKTYNEVLTAYQSGQLCWFSLDDSACVVLKDEGYPELYGYTVSVYPKGGGIGVLFRHYIEYTTSGITVNTLEYSLTEAN